jgi:hypothetical protein
LVVADGHKLLNECVYVSNAETLDHVRDSIPLDAAHQVPRFDSDANLVRLVA